MQVKFEQDGMVQTTTKFSNFWQKLFFLSSVAKTIVLC